MLQHVWVHVQALRKVHFEVLPSLSTASSTYTSGPSCPRSRSNSVSASSDTTTDCQLVDMLDEEEARMYNESLLDRASSTWNTMLNTLDAVSYLPLVRSKVQDK